MFLKNTAGQVIGAQLVSATDGSNVTTGTTTVYVTIDAGTQATGTVGSGAATHEGNGYWTYAPSQAETNGTLLAYTFVNSSAVSATVQVVGVSFDYTDAVRLGLTALPNAAADAAGGLPISDAGGLDLDGLNTNVSAILTDTGTTIPGVLGTPTGADLATDIANVQTDTTAILDDTGTNGVVVAAASKTGYRLSATGVDDIFDEALSGHVTAGSLGAALYVIRSGTAQGGSSTTIQLDASASATDDWYNNSRVFIVSGTGAGQGTYITDYVGSTTTATVQDTWRTNPSSDSVFVIVPAGGIPGASAPTAADNASAVWDKAFTSHTTEGTFGSLFQPAHVGTAQGGSSSSITLDATGSSSTTDFYKYAFVKIISGTGAGQSRQISAYNGTTKAATVSLAWTTTPDATSNYIVTNDFGIDAATVASIADGVWDEARSGHVTAGTFGEYVLADAVRVSGSTSAADGLEAAVAGSTPLPANVTQWLGTAAATPTVAGVPEVDITYVGGSAQDLPTATALATVDANVDLILEDTGTTIPGTISTLQSSATAIEADTQDIQSRLPAALVSGQIAASIEYINGVALAGDGSGTPFTVA